MAKEANLNGYLRSDGRKGIRNIVLVVYLVECARHIAQEIVRNCDGEAVELIGFPGCFPNDYGKKIVQQLCKHPNVGAVVIVSLGCEGFDRFELEKTIKESQRPVSTIVIQKQGGTQKSISEGTKLAHEFHEQIQSVEKVDFSISDLVIGTICGGSDGTSGLTGNPAAGLTFDKLIKQGATCIFEETGELIGCEHIMAQRAVNQEVADQLIQSVEKAANYYQVLGYGSFAPGNAEGGLSTIEEKSMGAYAKSGSSPISGLIKPGDIPKEAGLYLLDVVPDGEVRFGFPNISDNAEIIEMIASGAQIILFVTARGSVVGSAISPVIKICANPNQYAMLKDDMDINAGSIFSGNTLDGVSEEIFELTQQVINGAPTKSEALGHREFILTYKYFEDNKTNCAL